MSYHLMAKRKDSRRKQYKAPAAINSAFKGDAKAYGIVIYGENIMYSPDKQENSSIHINVSKEKIAEFIIKKVYEDTSVDVTNLIVAHEHGDENFKCHFQCCVKLVKRVNKVLVPFKGEVDNVKFIGMFQKAKNVEALWNYCKKDGDFFIAEPEGVCKDVWERIVRSKARSKSDITNLLANADPKSLLMWGDKIQNNYECLLKDEEAPEFEWSFPKHLTNFLDDISLCSTEDLEEKAKIKAIKKWFNEQCVTNNVTRRQCLFLISTERGLGKSEFAKRLVPHDKYFIYCRGSLDAAEFKKKENSAKLVILDDISYIGNEKEMWKALVAGESVNLNTKYHNFKWKGGLPCVVLTNEVSTAAYWSSSDLFSSQCCFINVRHYLGPPGTRPVFLGARDVHFDAEFRAKLDKFEKDKVNKKAGPFQTIANNTNNII